MGHPKTFQRKVFALDNLPFGRAGIHTHLDPILPNPPDPPIRGIRVQTRGRAHTGSNSLFFNDRLADFSS